MPARPGPAAPSAGPACRPATGRTPAVGSTCWSAPVPAGGRRRAARPHRAARPRTRPPAAGPRRLVDPGGPGQPAQVAYAETAGAQHRRRLGGERLQQRLGVAYRLHRLPGAGRVDRLRLARRGGRPAAGRLQRAERAGVPAQQQADLAGQLDRSPLAGAPGRPRRPARAGGVDQPAHRAGRPPPSSGRGPVRPSAAPAARPAARADRRAGGEPVQHARAAGGAASSVRRSFGRVGAEGGRPRVQLVGRSAQPGRVRRGHLVDRAAPAAARLRAVQQEERPQPVHGGPHVAGSAPRPGGASGEHGVDGGRCRRPDRGSAGRRRGSAG